MGKARRTRGPVKVGPTRVRLAAAAASALAIIGIAAPAAVAGTMGSSDVGRAPHAFTGSDSLVSVAATSGTNAWAVGSYFVNRTHNFQPLIEHWNGRGWQLSAVPSVGASVSAYLRSVSALSAKNAWAVGTQGGKALIEHWNGSRWHSVAGAAVRPRTATIQLAGVAAISAKSVWAVGSVYKSSHVIPLIEHWNGARWSVVPAPDPGGLSANDYLSGVAASKAGAWAVGTSAPGNIYRTVVLALVRGRWRQLKSPNPSGLGNWLGAVSAAGSHVLAAGFGGYDNPAAAIPLVAHHSGTAFQLDATPDPGGLTAQDELYGVAASTTGGWAVGRSAAQTLILRERSGHWQKVASPSWPSPSTSLLQGVTTRRGSSWAVGQYSVEAGPISVTYSLILRWTGTRWVRVHSPNR
jgi:hypothetical protein